MGDDYGDDDVDDDDDCSASGLSDQAEGVKRAGRVRSRAAERPIRTKVPYQVMYDGMGKSIFPNGTMASMTR